MSTPFDDLDAELSGYMGAEFGEVCLITHRISSEYTGHTTDPARPPQTVMGVFSSGPYAGRLDGGGRGDMKAMTAMFAETPVLWLSSATVAGLTHPIRQRDAVTFSGRPGVVFTVALVNLTDLRDVELHLTREDPS